MSPESPKQPPLSSKDWKKVGIVSLCIATLLVFLWWLIVMPARNFPIGETIEIKRGESLSQVATDLYARSVITSPLAYKIFARIASPVHGVFAGDYVFDHPLNLFEVVSQTTDLLFGQSTVRVTIPEGMNNRQMADLLATRFEHFDKEKFIDAARDYEGYLFPDTYVFGKGVPESEIVSAMRQNFTRKIQDLADEFKASGHSVKEIVIMASVLEREARTTETRQMIAGILWKRIDAGVPLQVDAALYYLFGKPTSQLTKDDIAVDSLYNTYKYKGLPYGPISNPGYYALRDAATPKTSAYWFYLSDKNGEMHYAKTYEQHLANKRKYLD